MHQALSTVYDLHQQPQPLGEKLAQGGEGEIYPLRDRPQILIKRYHPAVLAGRGAELRAKIEAMRNLAPLRENPQLAWPLIHVFDEHQQWIGYSMYRVKGVPMFKLAHALLYRRYFPGLDRRPLVDYLCSLTRQVQQLHEQQVMIGDYNLNNLMCDPQSDCVSFIDCDSYQIRIGARHYPCPVGSADMTAKEQQNQPFAKLVRTAQSEAFSLAIILFKVLMLGRHPYDIVGGADPVQNLCRGDFAYGLGNRGIPRGHWYNIWSHMPHRLKTLFIQTFTEGADQPQRRPTPAQWLEALLIYRRELDKGWHARDILPAQPKAATYQGSRSQA